MSNLKTRKLFLSHSVIRMKLDIEQYLIKQQGTVQTMRCLNPSLPTGAWLE